MWLGILRHHLNSYFLISEMVLVTARTRARVNERHLIHQGLEVGVLAHHLEQARMEADVAPGDVPVLRVEVDEAPGVDDHVGELVDALPGGVEPQRARVRGRARFSSQSRL